MPTPPPFAPPAGVIEYAGTRLALSQLQLRKPRRDGSCRVLTDDRTIVVRLGPEAGLRREYAHHAWFRARGLPVPELLSELCPLDDGLHYYVETYLGPATLGQLLSSAPPAPEVSEPVRIAAAGFLARLTDLQLADCAAGDVGAFAESTAFATIAARSPFPELMARFRERSAADLDGVPCVFCHGDFNLFNVFAAGVIDFQKSRRLLFGFDQLYCVINPRLFPPAGTERNRTFAFSPRQAADLLAAVDAQALARGLRPPAAYRDCLSIWVLINFLLHNGVLPAFCAWRYRLLERLLRAYLAGRAVFWPLVSGDFDSDASY